MACGRSPTGAAPIDNTTFYATLIINSNNCHGEYMQPGWIFCVNCHGRHFAGDAPNSLARICPVRFAARHRREHRTGLSVAMRKSPPVARCRSPLVAS
jgi:hypothetical protein